jgi:hypothetical protein
VKISGARAGAGTLRRATARRLFLALDALVDLFTMYGNLFRCIHTDTNLVTFDA